jgi:hypothetical protein
MIRGVVTFVVVAAAALFIGFYWNEVVSWITYRN